LAIDVVLIGGLASSAGPKLAQWQLTKMAASTTRGLARQVLPPTVAPAVASN